MRLEKRGTTYESFSYLNAGRDNPAFEIAKEIDRVPPFLVPLAAEEERRAEGIVRDNIMISMHEHPGLIPANVSETPAYIRQGCSGPPKVNGDVEPRAS